MHPPILLDLLRHGYLTREQLNKVEIDAVQVLMIQRAIEGFIPTVTVEKSKPIKPAEKPKHGKLIGTWGGKLVRRKVA